MPASQLQPDKAGLQAYRACLIPYAPATAAAIRGSKPAGIQISDDMQETQRINTEDDSEAESGTPSPAEPAADNAQLPRGARATEVIPQDDVDNMMKKRKKGFEE